MLVPEPKYIALNRRFHEFTANEIAAPDQIASRSEEYGFHGSLKWEQVLERKRVVMLASAGSGKSEEMRQQTRRLITEGKQAFYVRLEDLAKEPIEDLLLPADQKQFLAWKRRSSTTAWFFLDSVDELKLSQNTLETALRCLHRSIQQYLDRAHVVVSSRPTDWRFASDEATLLKWLPIPIRMVEKAEPTGEELFMEVISREKHSEIKATFDGGGDSAQTLCTVFLQPIAENEVEGFAHDYGVNDAKNFAAEIDRHNSWLFARRPLDLIELIFMWNAHGKLGSKQEQHSFNADVKLKDNPERRDAGVLSSAEAHHGAERLALAAALTRKGRSRYLMSE